VVLLIASCAQPVRPYRWDRNSETYTWPEGEVRLPRGFTFRQDRGTDTVEGHFTSPDGRVVVRLDIGGYAGVYAKREDAVRFAETVVDGRRVWIATQRRPFRVAVTFPDSGCANFYADSADGGAIEAIARSFRSRGEVTSGCR